MSCVCDLAAKALRGAFAALCLSLSACYTTPTARRWQLGVWGATYLQIRPAATDSWHASAAERAQEQRC